LLDDYNNVFNDGLHNEVLAFEIGTELPSFPPLLFPLFPENDPLTD